MATSRSAQGDARGGFLGKGIRRHDRLGRQRALIAGEGGHGGWKAAPNLLDVERDADDACRGDQHVLDGARDQPRRFSRHFARDQKACVACTRVGTTAVHDDRARDTAGPSQVIARHNDGRRLRPVRGEYGGGRRRPVRDEEREVQPSRLDARPDPGRPESLRRRDATRHRFQRFERRGGHRWRTASAESRSTTSDEEASSGSNIAYCPHLRNSGHFTQSVKIFSGSQRCGTIENPIRLK